MKADRTLTVVMLLVAGVASADWKHGVKAFEKGDWETAATELTEVTSGEPDNARAFFLLGESQRQLQRFDLAVSNFRKAVALDSNTHYYTIGLAKALLERYESEEAYELLASLDRDSIEVADKLDYALAFSKAATRTGRYNESIAILSPLTQIFGNHNELQKALGSTYALKGDNALASTAFARAFMLAPDDENCGRNAVRTSIEAAEVAKDSSERDSHYTRAIQIAERLAGRTPSFDHRMLAGEACMVAGRYREALEWADLAESVDPRPISIWLLRADCHARLGDLRKAAEDIRRAEAVSQTASDMGKIRDKKFEISSFNVESSPVESAVECKGIRATRWGMSPSEVIAIEGTPEYRNEETLGYTVTLAGKEVQLFFEFLNGKLARGAYMLSQNNVSADGYDGDFNGFKELLERKYGQPTTDDAEWKNDLFKQDRGQWGTAVMLGHAVFSTRWFTSETGIALVLSGGEFRSTVSVAYFSRELAAGFSDAVTKSALEDL